MKDTKYRKLLRIMMFIVLAGMVVLQIYEICFIEQQIMNSDVNTARVCMVVSLCFTAILIGLMLSEGSVSSIAHTKAYQDITGIDNKRACLEKLKEIENAENTYQVAVIMFDLNNLKRVNDNLGHEKGDELIQSFARLLMQAKNEMQNKNCTAYRVGGDEFMMIIQQTNEVEVRHVIDRMATLTQKYNETSRLKLSYAKGYEISTKEHYYVVDELTKRADEHMYKDKMEYKSLKERKSVS